MTKSIPTTKPWMEPYKSETPKIRTIKLKCGVEVTVNFGASKKCECGRQIWFGMTKQKRWMPICLVGLAEWDTHYADCPLAKSFRKKET